MKSIHPSISNEKGMMMIRWWWWYDDDDDDDEQMILLTITIIIITIIKIIITKFDRKKNDELHKVERIDEWMDGCTRRWIENGRETNESWKGRKKKTMKGKTKKKKQMNERMNGWMKKGETHVPKNPSSSWRCCAKSCELLFCCCGFCFFSNGCRNDESENESEINNIPKQHTKKKKKKKRKDKGNTDAAWECWWILPGALG